MALAVALLSLEPSLDQALREGFFDADGLASLPGLFHDAPIVRVFGGNAKRSECLLLANNGLPGPQRARLTAYLT